MPDETRRTAIARHAPHAALQNLLLSLPFIFPPKAKQLHNRSFRLQLYNCMPGAIRHRGKLFTATNLPNLRNDGIKPFCPNPWDTGQSVPWWGAVERRTEKVKIGGRISGLFCQMPYVLMEGQPIFQECIPSCRN